MGIQFYNGLSNYNGYNSINRVIPQVSPEEVKAQDELASVNNQDSIKAESSYSQDTPSKIDTRSRVASLEDISLTFNKEESFDYLNSDSSVKSLDMQKAISDMQKDSILQDYQYFVGSSKALMSDADGIVIPK